MEIKCPDDISVFVNRSVCKRKVVSWNIPEVNGTKYSIQVIPPWAVPPVELVNCSENAVYVITYVLRGKNGQTANCSFNITVRREKGEVQLFHFFWCYPVLLMSFYQIIIVTNIFQIC